MPSVLLCSPNHSISRDGVVTDTATRRPVPHCVVPAAHGVTHLGVRLGERTYLVWRLLSVTYHSNRLILPRDANWFSWKAENVFEVVRLSSLKISKPDEVIGVWHWYQGNGVPCRLLAEKTALLYYSDDDFRTLIGDLLLAGVR